MIRTGTLLAAVAMVAAGSASAGAQSAAKLLENAKVAKNLEYGKHQKQKLDLAVPAGEGPFPLIVWIHGGAWEMGSKDGFGPLINQVPRGYALASIGYRFSKDAVFPAQLLDAKEAIRYLRAHAAEYKLDPKRLAVSGASAGGHLASLVGTSHGVKGLEPDGAKPGETKVAAVVNFFGPADLSRLSPKGAPENPVTRLIGGDTAEKKDVAAAGTPQTHIDRDDPPFLIIHGDTDRVVPVAQSRELHESLTKAGIPSELFEIKGGGHGIGIFNKPTEERVSTFLDRYVKPRLEK